MRKITLIIWAGMLFLPISYSCAQNNQTETITISTYYPSPYGVYGTLQVKKGLAIGGSGYSTVSGLREGQIYLNNSVILNPHAVTPANSAGKAGEVIYVGGTDKMLKFHDGVKWVNATLLPPPCPVGKQCYTTDSSESCPVGQTCKAPGSTYFTTIWYEQVHYEATGYTRYYWSSDYFTTHESHNTPPSCPAGSSPIYSGAIGVSMSCGALDDDYLHYVIVCGN